MGKVDTIIDWFQSVDLENLDPSENEEVGGMNVFIKNWKKVDEDAITVSSSLPSGMGGSAPSYTVRTRQVEYEPDRSGSYKTGKTTKFANLRPSEEGARGAVLQYKHGSMRTHHGPKAKVFLIDEELPEPEPELQKKQLGPLTATLLFTENVNEEDLSRIIKKAKRNMEPERTSPANAIRKQVKFWFHDHFPEYEFPHIDRYCEFLREEELNWPEDLEEFVLG